MKPEVFESVGRVPPDLFEYRLAGENRRGLSSSLYPGRDVDTIADQIIARDDNVREMYTDPQGEPCRSTGRNVVCMNFPLNLDAAAHRVHRAGKLHHGRIARGAEDAPAEALRRFGYGRLTLRQRFRRRLFGGFHLFRIAHDIGGEDRGQAAFHALSPSIEETNGQGPENPLPGACHSTDWPGDAIGYGHG
jgi:hypothetical protein